MKRQLSAALVLISLVSGTMGFCAQAAPAVVETDAKGHTLTLAQHPQRIACLYAFAGHVTAMLGRGPDMVAVVRGLKKDRLLALVVPDISQLASPSAGGVIHVESLLKTGPDIVFLKPETAAIAAEIQKLERFTLPWFSVGYWDMQSQMAAIKAMGRILDREEKALAYTRYYTSVIQEVEKRTAGIPDEQRVRLYHSINEPLRTDGPGTLEADWTASCGVINVSVTGALKNFHNKNFAGMEQVLIWNPEIIIANDPDTAELIRTDKKWAPVRAVEQNKVFTIPVGISRWGHPGGLETPLAILWTAQKAYPHLFADLDMAQEVKRFYWEFFDMELEGGMIDRILSGRGMRKSSH